MVAEQTPRLWARGIGKAFPGGVALEGVDLRVGAGEVVALVGENGAGKSTLMKILAGVQRPDAGTLLVDGAPRQFRSVAEAQALGIALIHQELNLCDNLSVGANVFLGREPRRRGLIDEAAIRRGAAELLLRVGLAIDPGLSLAGLSLGQRQLVEIAKALSIDARVLIMDEPTSSLSLAETQRLFAVVHDLRRQGVSVIYISHRLGEVCELADRVVVLRDGRNAGSLARDEISHDRMVALMVGRELRLARSRAVPATAGAPRLRVSGLRTQAWPAHAIDFAVRAGEIVGLAGLVGAGRSELLRAIFGADAAVDGAVEVEGRLLRGGEPREAIAAGLALVPEDRKAEGLVLEASVRENLALPGLARRARFGCVDGAVERRLAAASVESLAVRTAGLEQVVRTLSGGNQQKLVLGKWLTLEPRVLLLDEPTRGIDVGSKDEIYALVRELASRGLAVLFASSEMEELLGLADRILVVHEGRLAGELAGADATEELVMQLATGGDAKGTAAP
ncbi:MAG: sugar ABC transporter ATP-binding protein [Planctomycetes bacterium]|nr:sugar ABC transporter ATP-binding protein [Planctomycetota bacterium]